MLERYPEFEKELDENVARHMNEYIKARSPIMDEVNKARYFEGNLSYIKREDESDFDEIEIKNISSESEIQLKVILYGTINEILDSFIDPAIKMAEEQEKVIIETIQATVDKTGNRIDLKGKGASVEGILSIYEAGYIDFDTSGRPIFPTAIIPPALEGKFRKAMLELREPKNKAKLEALLARKRMEWRDREANRVLVG